MQIESGLAPSLGEEALPALATAIRPYRKTEVHNITQLKTTQTKLDRISTSVVIGMTAQFVITVFGIVTEFMPRMLDNILLSIFVGLCVGVITFALLSEEQ